MMVGFWSAGLGASAIPDSVETQYRYEDNSDTTVALDSVGSNNANINGATYTSDSAVGSLALDHDGTDDNSRSQNSANLSTQGDTSGWSISAFIKPGEIANNWRVYAGWIDDSDPTRYAMLVEDGADGNGTYAAIIRTPDGGGRNTILNSGVNIDTTSYVHLYLEITDSDFSLKVDNTQEANATNPQSSADIGTGDYVTGDTNDGAFFDSSPGDVTVDDFSIANDPLTDGEVQSLIDR